MLNTQNFQKPKKKKARSYLDILRFEPKLMSSIAGKYLKNVRLMVILTFTMIMMGAISFFSLPRNLNPEVEIPYIMVSTALPGSGPEDVESLITIPLEKKIKNIDGVNNYESLSNSNFSTISIEFQSNYEISKAREEVQAAVDSVKDLPADASTPNVQELDFENYPIIFFALIKKNNQDIASLMRLAKRLKEKLEDNQYIDRVEITGLDKREIQIVINNEVIREKNLNPQNLQQAIQQSLSSYPAGDLQTDKSVLTLTIDQAITTIDELRRLPIALNGQDYHLSELAMVAERSAYDQAGSYFADHHQAAQPAVVFSVYKTRTSHINKAGAVIREEVDTFMKDYQDNFASKIVADYADMIDDQFNDLWDNFLQTLVLVFLSMFLLYGIRQASIAAAAIPLALLIVFIVMQATGISLNFLSIFSILIALGLFVDNAVVIIEAFTSYYRTRRFNPLQTAILVWKDYFIELFTINLLTVWAFLPLLITEGIMGEFIYPIPIIVSVAMMGSVAVAMLFTLPAMMLLAEFKIAKRVKVLLVLLTFILLLTAFFLLIPKTILFIPSLLVFGILLLLIFKFRLQLFQKTKAVLKAQKYSKTIAQLTLRAFDQGFISLHKTSQKYREIIDYLLNNRSARIKTLLFIIIFTITSYMLLPLGIVKNEFFPKSDQDHVYLELELPAGTKKEITDHEAQLLSEEIRQIPDIDFLVLELQQQASSYGMSSPGPNFALFSLTLVEDDQRQRSSMAIAQDLRERFKNYQPGKIRITEDTSGPPAGADLEIQLLGNDLDQLQDSAQQIQNFLANLEGCTNIDISVKTGTSKIVFEPQAEKLAQYRLNESQVAFWLRTMVSGYTLGDITLDDEDYDIVLKMNENLISPAELSSVQIPLANDDHLNQSHVALNDLGYLKLAPNPSHISRLNGQRSITVTASALPGYIPVELYKKLENFANTELNLPAGYSWKTGGANEENDKATISILQAMRISAILILTTMVLLLGSFRKALIVMLVIPLAVSGVFLVFALTGIPLSFPALIGMLSLFGIVIANSLMIVDKVNQNLAAGLIMKEAIIDAAGSRLEPIVLTSVSQVIGLIPITLSDPIWQGMGGAIIAGMMFSGVIMLFFIPIIYYYFFPEKK